MSLALLIIVLHVVQTGEARLRADGVPLVPRVFERSPGYTAEEVGFAILELPSGWTRTKETNTGTRQGVKHEAGRGSETWGCFQSKLACLTRRYTYLFCF